MSHIHILILIYTSPDTIIHYTTPYIKTNKNVNITDIYDDYILCDYDYFEVCFY